MRPVARLTLTYALIGAVILLAVYWVHFLKTPLVTTATARDYELKPGATVSTLTQDLQHAGVIKSPYAFKVLAYLLGVTRDLKAGEYRLEAGLRPDALLRRIAQGEVIQHQLTIIEGWTFETLLVTLQHHPKLIHSTRALTQAQLMQALGIAQGSPEGYFFPETYHFTAGTKDLALLTRAHAMLQEKLTQAWASRDKDLFYQSPYEALIVASLIEKETAVASEKPLVASVILNRLKKKMRLQIDPSVIYGLGRKFEGDLTKADLKTDTPYNTYLHKGLPPTPIALPGNDSLHAALHPATTAYYYFVSTGLGTHHFSKTLAEQRAAIVKYHRQDRESQ